MPFLLFFAFYLKLIFILSIIIFQDWLKLVNFMFLYQPVLSYIIAHITPNKTPAVFLSLSEL